MKMLRKGLVTILLLVSFGVVAQNLSKPGVLKMSIRGTGPIIQGDLVKGYYYFYKTDKFDSNFDNYLLSLHDEHLNEIREVEITRPKSYVLVDGVFNGEVFGFLFFDYKRKAIELMTYDRSLKPLANVTRLVSNKSMLASYNSFVSGGSQTRDYLVPIENVGFLYYGLKEKSKYQYEIQCYSNDLKVLWSQYSDGSGKVELAEEAFQSGEYVGSTISRKKSVSSKDVEYNLLVQEVSSGKKLFNVPMVTDQYSLALSNVFYDEGTHTLSIFGEYHDRADKQLKSNSLGFMILTLDMNGKIVGEKTLSWAKEISMAAPVNARGQFDGNNSRILFHKFVRTRDGSIFAIGEQYKKVENAAGIIGNVMLGAMTGNVTSLPNAQLNVYNMVVFEFTPEADLKKVHVFEKDKNVVPLPSGAEYLSPKMVSYYGKAYGLFDYAFTQRTEDQNTFYVTYVNYDREKGQASRNVLSSIIYTPEKNFVVDSMPLDRRSSAYFVFPAKEGFVMVTEYFRKEKRVDSRLEKVNY